MVAIEWVGSLFFRYRGSCVVQIESMVEPSYTKVIPELCGFDMVCASRFVFDLTNQKDLLKQGYQLDTTDEVILARGGDFRLGLFCIQTNALSMYIDDSEFETVHDETHADVPTFVCDHCGEEIQLMLDLSEGDSQQFVQDCSVC